MKEAKLLKMLRRIEQHADEIYIWTRKDGVLGNYKLTELPTQQAIQYVCMWVRNRLEEQE